MDVAHAGRRTCLQMVGLSGSSVTSPPLPYCRPFIMPMGSANATARSNVSWFGVNAIPWLVCREKGGRRRWSGSTWKPHVV